MCMSRVTRPYDSSLFQWDFNINLTSIKYIFSINYLTSITVRYSYVPLNAVGTEWFTPGVTEYDRSPNRAIGQT